ncbi:MAG: aminomethyltransferase family protein [Anaerolineales bacterium]|nr:aminomethyltransferase family protein [Anaerolineales bacterium]
MTNLATTFVKFSPLHASAEKLGARWLDVAGWRCPNDYGDPAAEMAALRADVGLGDLSPLGKIQIEGQAAAALLADTLGGAPATVGGHARLPAGDLYCLRPDLYFLSLPPTADLATAARLASAAAARPDLVTVTDVTHGLAAIALAGPRALEVLTRVCGLDFSPAAFPSPGARQSSVAKTRQLIVRRDQNPGLPCFTLYGARSLAAYVWGVLLDAGRPFALRPVGLAALSALETA